MGQDSPNRRSQPNTNASDRGIRHNSGYGVNQGYGSQPQTSTSDFINNGLASRQGWSENPTVVQFQAHGDMTPTDSPIVHQPAFLQQAEPSHQQIDSGNNRPLVFQGWPRGQNQPPTINSLSSNPSSPTAAQPMNAIERQFRPISTLDQTQGSLIESSTQPDFQDHGPTVSPITRQPSQSSPFIQHPAHGSNGQFTTKEWPRVQVDTPPVGSPGASGAPGIANPNSPSNRQFRITPNRQQSKDQNVTNNNQRAQGVSGSEIQPLIRALPQIFSAAIPTQSDPNSPTRPSRFTFNLQPMPQEQNSGQMSTQEQPLGQFESTPSIEQPVGSVNPTVALEHDQNLYSGQAPVGQGPQTLTGFNAPPSGANNNNWATVDTQFSQNQNPLDSNNPMSAGNAFPQDNPTETALPNPPETPFRQTMDQNQQTHNSGFNGMPGQNGLVNPTNAFNNDPMFPRPSSFSPIIGTRTLPNPIVSGPMSSPKTKLESDIRNDLNVNNLNGALNTLRQFINNQIQMIRSMPRIALEDPHLEQNALIQRSSIADKAYVLNSLNDIYANSKKDIDTAIKETDRQIDMYRNLPWPNLTRERIVTQVPLVERLVQQKLNELNRLVDLIASRGGKRIEKASQDGFNGRLNRPQQPTYSNQVQARLSAAVQEPTTSATIAAPANTYKTYSVPQSQAAAPVAQLIQPRPMVQYQRYPQFQMSQLRRISV